MSIFSSTCKRAGLLTLLLLGTLTVLPTPSHAQFNTHQTFCTPNPTDPLNSALVQILTSAAGTYKLVISGPGLNPPFQRTFTGFLALRDFVLPSADQPYLETYYLGTTIVKQDVIYSANASNGPNGGNFMQEQQLNSVSLAFSTQYPGTNFPYAVGIRLKGSTGPIPLDPTHPERDFHVFNGANGDGTYSWAFGNLPSNTQYEWVIVHGSTINVNDPTTQNFLTHHHVATNSF